MSLVLCQGNALHLPLADASVQCGVTSPPYYGLRDYGTAAWIGGDAACDHTTAPSRGDDIRPGEKQGTSRGSRPNTRWGCPCGATRVDAQLGLEPTLDAYLVTLVAVFREVKRVLRDDGTLWLNIGDSYAGSSMTGGQGKEILTGGLRRQQATMCHATRRTPDVLPKNLCMVPARLALALQQDGWYLRSEIVWHKPSCMPESVQDRPTRSHEMVYLFAKQPRYFYDAEAVREPASDWGTSEKWSAKYNGAALAAAGQAPHTGLQERQYATRGRNARSVWTIPAEPFPGEHFAAFPTALAERCILAGTSAHGCCAACGAPWQRGRVSTATAATSHKGSRFDRGKSAHHGHVQQGARFATVPGDWHPGCGCNAAARPCIVLDPFCGSGTTLFVARALQRHAVGVDLSWPYLDTIARARLGLTALAAWEGAPAASAPLTYTDLPLFQEVAP